MKAFLLIAALALSSCGKDSNPPAASTGAQAATPSPAPAPDNKPNPPDPHKPDPVKPGKVDAGYCPVVELAGVYDVSAVSCELDGASSAVDATAVPTKYLVVAQGEASGSVAMTVGAKTLTLTFPRNPDTIADSMRNGTFCLDLPTQKILVQNCAPGVKDCYYQLEQKNGKISAVFFRHSGSHDYECRADLAAR